MNPIYGYKHSSNYFHDNVVLIFYFLCVSNSFFYIYVQKILEIIFFKELLQNMVLINDFGVETLLHIITICLFIHKLYIYFYPFLAGYILEKVIFIR